VFDVTKTINTCSFDISSITVKGFLVQLGKFDYGQQSRNHTASRRGSSASEAVIFGDIGSDARIVVSKLEMCLYYNQYNLEIS
jgi:hypothetical protein